MAANVESGLAYHARGRARATSAGGLERTPRRAAAAPIRPALSYGTTILALSLSANLPSVSSCRIATSVGSGLAVVDRAVDGLDGLGPALGLEDGGLAVALGPQDGGLPLALGRADGGLGVALGDVDGRLLLALGLQDLGPLLLVGLLLQGQRLRGSAAAGRSRRSRCG